MKIALCLHGLVGSTKGKNGDLLGGSDQVLSLSLNHNSKFVITENVDVFVHSWSTELRDEIISLYLPKKFNIEPQIEFKVPDYIKSDHKRAFSHLSRWYSFRESVRFKKEYEQAHNFKYDFILVQRFDLCWNRKIEFETMNKDRLYVGLAGLNVNKEWSDRWFISNSTNMDKFASLYELIPTYMGPGGTLTSRQQYAGISSHFLVKHHAEQLKLTPEFKYTFGGYGEKPDDYNEVRRMYYEDK
jgi:hypothetical protein